MHADHTRRASLLGFFCVFVTVVAHEDEGPTGNSSQMCSRVSQHCVDTIGKLVAQAMAMEMARLKTENSRLLKEVAQLKNSTPNFMRASRSSLLKAAQVGEPVSRQVTTRRDIRPTTRAQAQLTGLEAIGDKRSRTQPNVGLLRKNLGEGSTTGEGVSTLITEFVGEGSVSKQRGVDLLQAVATKLETLLKTETVTGLDMLQEAVTAMCTAQSTPAPRPNANQAGTSAPAHRLAERAIALWNRVVSWNHASGSWQRCVTTYGNPCWHLTVRNVQAAMD